MTDEQKDSMRSTFFGIVSMIPVFAIAGGVVYFAYKKPEECYGILIDGEKAILYEKDLRPAAGRTKLTPITDNNSYETMYTSRLRKSDVVKDMEGNLIYTDEQNVLFQEVFPDMKIDREMLEDYNLSYLKNEYFDTFKFDPQAYKAICLTDLSSGDKKYICGYRIEELWMFYNLETNALETYPTTYTINIEDFTAGKEEMTRQEILENFHRYYSEENFSLKRTKE